MFDVKLFGKFEVLSQDGAAINVAGAKTQGLIAFLAMNMGMPPTRDRIVNLFWGDRFTDQARQSLRQAIAKLRRILPDGDRALVIEHDRISFDPAVVRVDLDRFTELAENDRVQDAIAAVALLRGPLLDGFFGQQAEFEDWISSERQSINELSCKLLERAADAESRNGNMSQALVHARRVTQLNPWSDAAHGVLLRLLAQNGERAQAIQHFQKYESTLKDELGIGVGQELRELIAQIRGETFAPAEHSPNDPALSASPPASALPMAERAPDAADGQTSIAIVPFAWMASEADHGFLVDGLVEDMSTKLSRFSWLTIKAGANTHGARLTGAEMSALFGEQGIDYLIHGSLRSQGNRFRLTVQLADPRDGRYLWVERFDRSTDDLFSLQDDLSDAVVGSLEASIARLAGRSTRSLSFDDMNAWECYHRGLAIQYEFDAATNSQAQRHFRRAIALDPNFGLAYARLSYAIVISAIYFEAADVTALLDDALELAQTASRLEPDDAVVRFALGRVLLARGEYDQSISHLKSAIELNPNMAQAHCGLGDSMAYAGDLDAAMSCFEEAVRVSPNDPYRWAFLSYGATALLFRGDFLDADKWAAEAESMPNAHYWPIVLKNSEIRASRISCENL
ncbi:MAG: tetratricopeptide repeat protein [Rhodobacteraceae bacterium]|nr:tetratricopeptide repeat protein [Paracoccaceae bacterium]